MDFKFLCRTITRGDIDLKYTPVSKLLIENALAVSAANKHDRPFWLA